MYPYLSSLASNVGYFSRVDDEFRAMVIHVQGPAAFPIVRPRWSYFGVECNAYVIVVDVVPSEGLPVVANVELRHLPNVRYGCLQERCLSKIPHSSDAVHCYCEIYTGGCLVDLLLVRINEWSPTGAED